MEYTDLNMTFVSDGTDHQGGHQQDASENPAVTGHHWMVNSYYGRDALKSKLRQMQPTMKVPAWTHAEHLDDHLDDMVTSLGLQHLPKPQTIRQRMAYLKFIGNLGSAITRGAPLPEVPSCW